VLRLCQVIRPVPRLCIVIRHKYWVLRGRVVSPPPNPQAGGPPTVSCLRLLIQYIRSYPPYLEAVFSILNPRTRHAVVTVDPLVFAAVTVCITHILSSAKAAWRLWKSMISVPFPHGLNIVVTILWRSEFLIAVNHYRFFSLLLYSSSLALPLYEDDFQTPWS
jgi:hypothetical protein